jgi:hypothetical protein
MLTLKVFFFISDEVVCVWIDVVHDAPYNPPPFQPIANFFGIWHEHKRGNHRGLHEFYWEDNYILLLNVYVDRNHRRSEDGPKTYRHMMPTSARVMAPASFDKKFLESRIARKVVKEHIFKASSIDQSCNDVSSTIVIFISWDHLNLLVLSGMSKRR